MSTESDCDCDERAAAMWRLLRHVADGPTPEAQAELAAALVTYYETGRRA